MDTIQTNYKLRAKNASAEMKSMSAKANTLVMARVLVFGLMILMVYLTWGNVLLVFSSILIIGLGFGYLIKWHSVFNEKKRYWNAIHEFYQNELKATESDFSWANDGEEYKEPYHAYANDVDLFGHHSFFHKLNRTSTLGGESMLANKLASNDVLNIIEKQKAIRELSMKMDFHENFVGIARTNKSNLKPETISNWFKNYSPVLNVKLKFLLWIFPILSAICLGLYVSGVVSGVIFGAWFTIGLVLTGVLIKNTLKFNSEINRIADNIRIFGKLLTQIEAESFESELLQGIQKEIKQKDIDASKMLHSFVKKVDLFNNRNNFLVGIFGNALLLWDSQTIYGVERWIMEYKNTVQNWIAGIFEMDAMLSLAIHNANHPHFTFPTIGEEETPYILKGKNVGHPLLKKEVCVTNDVEINNENFLIITGANMAGKSTFLRTVGLSIVMTNVGLPLFAEEITIKPQKLISSMRTEDSLKDDESYFFAELKRLKFIIDTISIEPHFIILDEILKGTNSKDKEEGSKQFVKKLVGLKASGIIATHDLGLCTISESIPQVKNFYYDAEIVNDELFFDYKMKNGVCKNMNASFLLRKMEIV